MTGTQLIQKVIGIMGIIMFIGFTFDILIFMILLIL